jgi:hypothetical protein
LHFIVLHGVQKSQEFHGWYGHSTGYWLLKSKLGNIYHSYVASLAVNHHHHTPPPPPRTVPTNINKKFYWNFLLTGNHICDQNVYYFYISTTRSLAAKAGTMSLAFQANSWQRRWLYRRTTIIYWLAVSIISDYSMFLNQI